MSAERPLEKKLPNIGIFLIIFLAFSVVKQDTGVLRVTGLKDSQIRAPDVDSRMRKLLVQLAFDLTITINRLELHLNLGVAVKTLHFLLFLT